MQLQIITGSLSSSTSSSSTLESSPSFSCLACDVSIFALPLSCWIADFTEEEKLLLLRRASCCFTFCSLVHQRPKAHEAKVSAVMSETKKASSLSPSSFDFTGRQWSIFKSPEWRMIRDRVKLCFHFYFYFSSCSWFNWDKKLSCIWTSLLNASTQQSRQQWHSTHQTKILTTWKSLYLQLFFNIFCTKK